MHVTRDELDRFHDFAVSLVSHPEADLTWSELLELWRLKNPSVEEHDQNISAIQQALEAMDAGRTRRFCDFDSDFRARYGIQNNE